MEDNFYSDKLDFESPSENLENQIDEFDQIVSNDNPQSETEQTDKKNDINNQSSDLK